MSGSYNDSTEEQKLHGMSIDTQILALQQYCEENGYSVFNIYNDAGFSARKSYKRRPGLLQMIEDCQKFDIILFTRLDRFCRSVKDYYSILAKLNGKPWRAIWEDYETETPDGMFKVNIMLSIGQAESDKTSARIKDSYQYRKAKGIYYGMPPLGYKVKDGQLYKDPQTKDGVQAMFDAFLENFSTSDAIHRAEQFGIKLCHADMYKKLINPAYAGETYNGHKCEPYITKEQHELICSVKKARQVKRKYPQRVYIFSGLLICGYCGRRMVGKTHEGRKLKNGNITHYSRYLCQGYMDTYHKCPTYVEISTRKIENILLSRLDAEISNLKYQASITEKDVADKLKERDRLNKKLERVKEMYIEGEITKDTYREKKMQIERDLSMIHIENHKIPELPKNWQEIYNELTPESRQSFWRKIIDRVILTRENKEHPDIFFRK